MKYLVVNSDDFGMCHSVNLGILKGFTDGILTQSTFVAPCPWFEEAVHMAKEYNIPCGVHLTAGCDWDIYRWRPITMARSLVMDDGCFFHTRDEVKNHGNFKEIEAEFEAQIELVISRGIKPTHIDVHMWLFDEDMVANLCRKYKILSRCKFSDKNKDCMYSFDTRSGISTNKPKNEKKAWLKDYLKNLKDGYHFLCCHLGAASSEMDSVCSKDYSVREWAQDIRVSDLEVITDLEIKSLCKELDIKLISVNDMK